MTIENVLASSGVQLFAEEGESSNIVGTFLDMAGAAINKASLVTLTCSLVDEASGSTINSRSSQSILDANGGAVTTEGVLTLRLQPADNAIVGSIAAGQTENHILRITWTWSDGVLTRTGKWWGRIGVVSDG